MREMDIIMGRGIYGSTDSPAADQEESYLHP